MPELKTSLGFKYLQETKFDRETIRRKPRPQIADTALEKEYPQAQCVDLPQPDPGLDHSFSSLLRQRRSRRRYGESALSLEALAALAWAAQGVTGQAGPFRLRTAPSAGALFPFETYVALRDVQGVAPGLYHLRVRDFCLETLAQGTYAREVAQGCLDQGFVAQAPVVFVWSAVLRRNMMKYGHRGLRYICMDLGHVCQNVVLAAEALGLGACPVAALYDDELNRLFGLDGQEESVLYAASVGPV